MMYCTAFASQLKNCWISRNIAEGLAIECQRFLLREHAQDETCSVAGLIFAAMYFICRVVISNYFGWVMLWAVLSEPAPSVSGALGWR